MGDNDTGAAAALNVVHDLLFHDGIQRAGCLVHHKNTGVQNQSPGNLQPLSLTARQILSLFRQFEVVSARQSGDRIVDAGVLGRTHNILLHNAFVPKGQVIPDGAGEDRNILANRSNAGRNDLRRYLPQRNPVHKDLPVPRFVQAADDLCHGGFSTAGGTHQRH